MLSEVELDSYIEKLDTKEYISFDSSDFRISNRKAQIKAVVKLFIVFLCGNLIASILGSIFNSEDVMGGIGAFALIIAIVLAIKTFKEHSVPNEYKEKLQNVQEEIEKHNKEVYNIALKTMLEEKGVSKLKQEITLSQWWYVREEKFGVDDDKKAIVYYKFCFQASTSSASTSSFIKKASFNDILKYEVIDNSTTTQTATSITSSNSGKALGGAIVSSLLIDDATTGAIIGGSGARVTETTFKTSVENSYQIVIYLNSLENSTIAINTTCRNKVNGIVSILEYALRNQGTK